MLSTLIQILKAIHNTVWYYFLDVRVVCYLLWYKFWKLFTTCSDILAAIPSLYVIYFDTNFESYSQLSRERVSKVCCCMLSTLIQILKAIHNFIRSSKACELVVCYLLWYKFWKLFTTYGAATAGNRGLYVIYFDTNFESYSQLVLQARYGAFGCMLSTLIQILKAIHNMLAAWCL